MYGRVPLGFSIVVFAHLPKAVNRYLPFVGWFTVLKVLFQMGCRYSFLVKPIKVPEVADGTKELSRDLQMTCLVCRHRTEPISIELGKK